MGQARGLRQNVKKGFFMTDKILLSIGGLCFVGLLLTISASAISTGFVFQGVLVGAMGVFWAFAFVYMAFNF